MSLHCFFINLSVVQYKTSLIFFFLRQIHTENFNYGQQGKYPSNIITYTNTQQRAKGEGKRRCQPNDKLANCGSDKRRTGSKKWRRKKRRRRRQQKLFRGGGSERVNANSGTELVLVSFLLRLIYRCGGT